jgi:hypothetical protein
MSNTYGEAPEKTKPVWTVVSTSAPSTVPVTLPRPPNRLVPPSTTAVMTVSS